MSAAVRESPEADRPYAEPMPSADRGMTRCGLSVPFAKRAMHTEREATMARRLLQTAALAVVVVMVLAFTQATNAQGAGVQLVFHDVPREQQLEVETEWASVSKWFSEEFGLDEPHFTLHLGLAYESVRHLLEDGHDPNACQWSTRNSSILTLPCDTGQSFPVLFISRIGIGAYDRHVIEPGHRLLGPWWLDRSLYDYLDSSYATWPAGSLETERSRRKLSVSGARESLRELETADQWRRNYQLVRNLGWLGVDWLAQLSGDTSFVEYMTGRGKHRHWNEAFEAHFGLSPDSFYRYFAPEGSLPKRVITGATKAEADPSERTGLWLTTVLHPGLNAIGWVEESIPTASLFESIPEAVAMFAWDGAEQKWRFARRGDTTTGNLSALDPGMGILMRVASERPIAWIRRIAPRQAKFLSGTLELHVGWNLVSWGGPSNTPNILRGELGNPSRWSQSKQDWRSGGLTATNGGSPRDSLAHGEALWVNSIQAGLWRQTPTGWWPESEPLPDWIASIQFWGEVDIDDQLILADRAADVSYYFKEWLGVSTAPRVHVAADDAAATEMYREVRGLGAFISCDQAGVNETLMNLSCFETAQRIAFSFSHEYFHTLQLGASDASGASSASRLTWLLEGGAKYAENRYLNDRRLDSYEAQRAGMIRHMEQLDVKLRESTTYDSVPAPYFLGMLAWERLVEKAGDFSLIGYYRNRALSTTSGEAFDRTFGLTLDEFYKEFEAWRAAGFPRE